MSSSARLVAVVGTIAAVLLVTSLDAAAKRKKRTISKLSVDPTAEKVDMFEGMKNGSLDVKLVHKNSLSGNMLVENKTDKPLTVKLPDAFVGVHVLKQVGGGIGGGGGGAGGGGGGQSSGGGGGGQQGGGQQGGGGAGFFSVPPHRVVRVPFKSVCLEHGKAEPRAKMNYRPIPVEKFSKNPVLKTLLRMVASGRIDPKSAQAAAWNLSNDMSWRQLAAKNIKHLGGRPPTPYFTVAQIQRGQQLVDTAKIITAKEAKGEKKKADAEPKRTESRVRTR